MFAVIETGGKQYKVAVGDSIFVEKLEAEAGSVVKPTVLLISDNGVNTMGKDIKAEVTAEVVETAKGSKLIIYKYKAKKNVRKKAGHRQWYTKLVIKTIG